MKKSIFLFSLFCIFSFVSAGEADSADGEEPFNFGIYQLKADSPVSAANLNHPITDKDRIKVSKDGHLEADGKRLRIFGTNLSEFPSKNMAEYCAALLANQGYNCIRFHHTDADWSKCFIKRLDNGKRVVDYTALDKFDYFFAELKKQGIYSDINLLTGRCINSMDPDFLPEIDKISDWKMRHCAGFWDQNARNSQKKWADFLLNHVNPYTGIAYKDDPAVCIVEVNNENGLMMGYLTNWLDEYTGTYWQELEDLYNQWLTKNGYDYDMLSQKFNQSTENGPVMLDDNSKFHLEAYDGGKAEVSVKNGEHVIHILENSPIPWQIQYNCPNLSFEKSKIYTISFDIKSNKDAEIPVTLMQAHSPWKNAGWSYNVKAIKKYTHYSFTLTGITTDTNLRLNFGNMGKLKGSTVSIKNIRVSEGGSIEVVKQGKKSTQKTKTVSMPYFSDYNTYPDEYKNIVMNFLYDTEYDYWKDMNDYLKNTIGIKALSMGTITGCSPANIQSIFDIIDSHAYWNHPAFPVSDWDPSRYYVNNLSLVKASDGGTLTTLASKRVYGKPFSVTEYDHPYPNQFNSEAYPMLAAFASYQDWDCIFTFCSNLPDSKNLTSNKISSYFNQTSNPVKSCAAPFAAKIFRNFLIQSDKTPVYYRITASTEKENLYKSKGWAISTPDQLSVDSSISFFYPLGLVLDEKIPENGIEASSIKNQIQKLKEKPFYLTQNQQILWDVNQGIFTACSPDALVCINSDNASLKEEDIPDIWKKQFPFAPFKSTEFSSLMCLRHQEDYVVFGSSWCGNKGEQLSVYGSENNSPLTTLFTRENLKLTTLPGYGRGPAKTFSINGCLNSNNKMEYNLYKLDLNGYKTENKITSDVLPFSKTSGTLWYLISR